MNEIHSDHLNAQLRKVGKAGNGTGRELVAHSAGIRAACFVDRFMDGGKNFGGLKRWEVEKAAPDLTGRETASLEPSDDVEIVTATLARTPKIRLGRFGGVDD